MKQKTDLLVLYQALYQAVMPLRDAVLCQYAGVMNTDEFEEKSEDMALSDILDFASCIAAEVEWSKAREKASEDVAS